MFPVRFRLSLRPSRRDGSSGGLPRDGFPLGWRKARKGLPRRAGDPPRPRRGEPGEAIRQTGCRKRLLKKETGGKKEIGPKKTKMNQPKTAAGCQDSWLKAAGSTAGEPQVPGILAPPLPFARKPPAACVVSVSSKSLEVREKGKKTPDRYEPDGKSRIEMKAPEQTRPSRRGTERPDPDELFCPRPILMPRRRRD